MKKQKTTIKKLTLSKIKISKLDLKTIQGGGPEDEGTASGRGARKGGACTSAQYCSPIQRHGDYYNNTPNSFANNDGNGCPGEN